MCGRVVYKTPVDEIRVLFETVNALPNAAPSFNAAPTDMLPLVRLDRDDKRSLDLLRWGLLPWWSEEMKIGRRCINAMAETVTGPPNELVAPIHNRMPVILAREAWRIWLGEDEAEPDELLALLQRYPAELTHVYAVDVRVGNVDNNEANLLDPIAA